MMVIIIFLFPFFHFFFPCLTLMNAKWWIWSSNRTKAFKRCCFPCAKWLPQGKEVKTVLFLFFKCGNADLALCLHTTTTTTTFKYRKQKTSKRPKLATLTSSLCNHANATHTITQLLLLQRYRHTGRPLKATRHQTKWHWVSLNSK